MSRNKRNTNYPVAILVDGGFFLKRYFKLIDRKASPEKVAKDLFTMCLNHVDENHLYRIMYYDCSPLDLKIHNPISKKFIDFGNSPIATWRLEFFKELKRKRKVALRLGEIKTSKMWHLHPGCVKDLLKRNKKISDITEQDISLDMRQKGIDIKIGVDITSIALKKHAREIVLISGDSDFVPAAKLARREGIDFILDPMYNNIDPNLFEHVDGIKSTIKTIGFKPPK